MLLAIFFKLVFIVYSMILVIPLFHMVSLNLNINLLNQKLIYYVYVNIPLKIILYFNYFIILKKYILIMLNFLNHF